MIYNFIISIESEDELEPEELDEILNQLEDKTNSLGYNINEVYWEEE